MTTDVAVIGGGLIAHSVALAVADRGASVALLHAAREGAASGAAAGLLAVSIEQFPVAVRRFAESARAAFPGFVRDLEARAGTDIPFSQLGILDIALSEEQAAKVHARMPPSAAWLEDAALRALEPALAPTCGGVFWEGDGTVDNTALLAALVEAVRQHHGIRVVEVAARSVVRSGSGALVATEQGRDVAARHVVLAAGAWSAAVQGAEWAGAVEPVRGQLLALGKAVVSRPVHCDDSYVVPRAGYTIAGSTMEWTGFDAGTTPEALEQLAAAAAVLCPRLADAPVLRGWAGLRPVTPDRLPLIGPDPSNPALIYACGHSRNGILMAPATATAVAQIIFEDSLTFDLHQFRPDRFRGTFRRT